LKPSITLIVSALAIFLQWNVAGATTITAVANGNWNSGSTWSLGRVPTCGDTVVIPAGKTVTVASQENLVPCGLPVIIYVSGTFQFTNGNKIDFPCGSWVYLLSGGIVKKATAGGGSSTLISICGYVEWKAGDGPISGIDSLGGHGTLPVSWLTFQGNIKDKKADLEWSTASEINNDYFNVVWSTDGITYTSIGKVEGNGNSTSVNYYSFTDFEPASGINYYKLIQVDFDGKQNPSDVIAVYNSAGTLAIDEVHLAPNPVAENTVVTFTAQQKCSATIEIKNASGQTCLSQSATAHIGTNSIFVERLSKLTKGIYTVVISTANGSSKPAGLIKK